MLTSSVLHDDLKKFISDPLPPPQEVEIPEEGKTKAKERREVGEGDDTVVVEDTSDEDDDEETLQNLQNHFHLRSRFSQPGLPHVPLMQDPLASLEASLAAPPRRPRIPARKRVSKKLKVSETTPQEVSHLEWCSRVLISHVHLLMTKLPCLQEVPPTEPVEQGDEEEWDTVGEPAGSRSPSPTVEEVLAQMERQLSAHQESTEPAAAAAKEVVAAGAQESAASGAIAAQEQWPQRCNRRRPPRLDWWTSPASLAPRP
jgi:hypothetical protein